MPKKIVGLIEKVIVKGEKSVSALALFDTGATSSSIDLKLAAKARLGPVIGTKKVKKAEGDFRRPIVKGKIKILGQLINARFTLADRSELGYLVLIGRDIIHKYYIIDPSKTHESNKSTDIKKSVKKRLSI